MQLGYGYHLRIVRAVISTAVALLLLLTSMPAASAGPSELEAARARATGAARRLSDASRQLATLKAEIAELEQQAQANEARLVGLEAAVREQAIHQFVHGGVQTSFVLADDISRTVRANALARFVTVDVEDSRDEYRALREDLDDAHGVLTQKREAAASAVAEMERQAAAARAELRRLEQLEAERRAREEAARRAQARRSGVRTVSARPTVIASGSWICPVQGPRAFTNDYGDPRSGGRRHQGIDILSPRGTPVVASVSGFVTHRTVSLGGLSYYLRGNDGITYFGTHLSGYGAGGRVEAGTVIGYVGDTGNARGTPHLHFEMQPGGGASVNPYPTLARYC